jgi:hypothetical protein
MTERTQVSAETRDRLLKAVEKELTEFDERKGNEFRRKDRAERAAELRLPID